MRIRVFTSKIHRATVTQAELGYAGSITIDKDLLEASGIKPFQLLSINNTANGVHWETYAIEGPAGGGGICLNGPPARNFHPGDIVIILAYADIELSEYKDLNPVVVFVDGKNKVTEVIEAKKIKHDE